jgi:hypothetical protein
VEHSQAQDTYAAERYLLGELTSAEVEEFERHYFECAECAMAVETGGQFIGNARAAFADSKEPALRRSVEPSRGSFRDTLAAFWRQPAFVMTLTAALVFGAVALYQGTVLIPGMRRTLDSARALPAFQLIGASRGEEAQVTVPAGTVSFALSVDIPPGTPFPKYLGVLSEGGRTVFEVVSPAPVAGEPITILVPVRGMQQGNQDLTVYGLRPDGERADKIAAWSFGFQFGALQFKP